MIKIGIFACAFVACLALPQQKGTTLLPSSTPVPSSGGVCADSPINILDCLNNPKVVDKKIAEKCKKRRLSECDSLKCVFRESGWASPGDKVNKQKVTEYFNQYAIDHPEWSAAVQHLKTACLDKDLPAQGVTKDCEPYDVFHCIETSFIRNALPTQWRSTAVCEYPRWFAASCPICPGSCFAPLVPYGSCNACLSLPTAPTVPQQ